MAITDNTAKWQVKKITNFTDKSAEIATQAQAEEGVDNTKMMTPLRVKNAIDKQRRLKTFYSLSQLGLNNTSTLEEIINALPQHSILQMYVSHVETSVSYVGALQVPSSGVLTIKRTDTINHSIEFNLSGIVYSDEVLCYKARYSELYTPSFSGWKKLAVTDKFLPLSGGTMTGAITCIPNDAIVGESNNNILNICGGTDNDGGAVVTLYGKSNSTESVKGAWSITANDGTKNSLLAGYPGGWLSFNGKKVATNGALSMPSANYIDVNVSVLGDDGFWKYYSPPTDGWVYFYTTYTSSVRMKVNAPGGDALIVTASAGTNDLNIQGCVVPVAKGQVVAIHASPLTALGNAVCRFTYAQSEV